jgi:hypothetical protein
MIKKIWLLLLSLFVIFWFWTSFADIIPINSYRVDSCVKIENPVVWWYRAVQVVENANCHWEVYEIKKDKCLEQHYQHCDSYIYLVPSFVTIKWKIELLKNNILIGEVNPNWWYYSNSNWLYRGVKTITEEYKIIRLNWKYKLKLTKMYNSDTNESLLEDWENSTNSEEFIWHSPESHISIKLISFTIARLATIFIETLILFLISKFCWTTWSFKNRKLIITWVLASTVTLPLLRFVLPMFFSNYWIYVIFWEILVTIIEVFIIKYILKIKREMAIFASVLCNLCSFLVWLFSLIIYVLMSLYND